MREAQMFPVCVLRLAISETTVTIDPQVS